MSSMRVQFVQKVTPDLRLDDQLWLRADSPAAMAADGLAFGESYRPPRRGRPPVGLRQCWIRTVGGLLPGGRCGRRYTSDGYQPRRRTRPGRLGMAAMREAITLRIRCGTRAQLGKLSTRVS